MTEPRIEVNTPPVTLLKSEESDDLIITGIASTTNKDLQNEIVSKEAIVSMQKQVVGLNLHLDHNHKYDGAIGVITESEITKDNELYITAKIFKTYANDIRERLNFGMKFGFSIGGIPQRNKAQLNIINDIKLLEISLTPLPANYDSYGSVEIVKGVIVSNCFGKACHYLLKNMETKNMSEEKEEVIETTEEVADPVVEDEATEKSTEPVETEEVTKSVEKEVTTEEDTEEVEVFSEKDAVQLFNELMAEKEQVIVEELASKMESSIESIVKNVVETLKGEPKEDEPKEEDVAPKEDEEEPVEETEETTEEDEVAEKKYPNLEEKPSSKLDVAMKTVATKSSFLDSETRDIFGRNKKYL